METKVDIIQNYNTGNLEIWVFEFDQTRQWNVTLHPDGGGSLVRTSMPEAVNIINSSSYKPFICFTRFLGAIILKSLYEWHEQNGTKTVNQNFTEGRMQSTLLHLEDMRKIAFSQLGIIMK